MSESLRDQLLKSGLAKPAHDKPRPHGRHGGGKAAPAKPAHEMDLAKAYAIRAQAEAKERKAAQREAEEQARLRRERKQKLTALLDGKVLNKPDTELVRNFEYGGKIRRMHVDAAQLAALNAGEMGIVQFGGRYLLVSGEVARQVRMIDPHHLALLVDPQAPATDDDGVPDDLVW